MASKEEQEKKEHIKEVYLEILRKDEYAQWKANPQLVGDTPLTQKTADSLRPIGQEYRLDISHLNQNFVAWHAKSCYSPHSALLECYREQYDG